jgi:hypothetical protein
MSRFHELMKYLIAGLMVILVPPCAAAEGLPLCVACADTYVHCDEDCFRNPQSSARCVKSCEAGFDYCKSNCVDEEPLANARVPDSLLGRYEGWSRACQGDVFTLSQQSVSFGDCTEQPYQLLEADDRHVVINVQPSKTCSAKVIKFEKELPGPKGLSFGGYILKWGESQRQIDTRCNFGNSKAPFSESGGR